MLKKITFITMMLTGLSALKAQDCQQLYPFDKGTVTEITSYDKKGTPMGATTYEVTNITQDAGITKVDVRSNYKPVKGDENYNSEYTYFCEGSNFYVDMKSYLDNNAMSSYKDMQIEMQADKLSYPSELSVGMQLEGGTVTATISNNGMKLMTMQVEINERKVEAIETITTKAGSFECYKITQLVRTKTGFVNTESKSIEWISKGVGSVKSETYTKNDKLLGYSELTGITKP